MELVFAFPKGLLRLSSLINVGQDAVPADHTAVASFQWRSAYGEPPILVVCSPKSAERVVSSPGFKVREPSPRFEPDIVRMDSFRPSPAHDFAERRAKIFKYTPVDVVDVALGASCPHQRRNRVHQQTKVMLAA